MTESVVLKPVRRAFIVAFGLGSAVIVYAGWEQRWQIYALGFAIVVMGGYAAWIGRYTKSLFSIDQLADSLYYLGFMFTLVALVANLLPDLGRPSQDQGAAVVMGRFGLALVTTIVGLGGRLLLIQFRREGTDEEHDAREQISAAVFQLAHELDQSVVYLRDARVKAAQAIGESSEEAINAIREVATSASSALEKMAGASTDAVTRRTEEIVGLIRGASEESATAMREFTEETITQTGRVIDDFEKKVEALSLPDDLFAAVRDKLETLEQGVEDLAASVNSHVDASKELVSSIRGCVSGIQGLNEGVEGAKELFRRFTAGAEGVQKLSISVKTLETAITGYGMAIEKHSMDVGEWSRRISQELDSVLEYRDQIQQATADASRANLRVLDNLVENARFLREELE